MLAQTTRIMHSISLGSGQPPKQIRYELTGGIPSGPDSGVALYQPYGHRMHQDQTQRHDGIRNQQEIKEDDCALPKPAATSYEDEPMDWATYKQRATEKVLPWLQDVDLWNHEEADITSIERERKTEAMTIMVRKKEQEDLESEFRRREKERNAR